MAKSIYVADDELHIRNLIQTFLANEGYEVRTFADGDSLFQAFSERCPDLIILDIMMPGTDGLSLCARIRGESRVPIMIVSAKDSPLDRVTGITLGSDDYMVKPFLPLELVARVKSQMRRYTQLGNLNQQADGQIYKCGGLQINDDNKEVTVDGDAIKLTPIEYNILLLLVKNAGKVFSIDEIYEQIWNEEAIGADNTVAVHIRHIREKIEINPREPKYLKVVWGVGYKIEKQ